MEASTSTSSDDKKFKRKQIRKMICKLDDLHPEEVVTEIHCELCQIIVPDDATMMKHASSVMHLKRLAQCYIKSFGRSDESKSVGSDTSSDSDDDDVPQRTARNVLWNDVVEVAKF